MTDSVVKYADLAVSNLTAGGGKLLPEQADTFYRKVFDRTGLIGDVRTIQMNADTMNINKIGLANRILRVAPTGTAPYEQDNGINNRNLPAADRFNPQFEQISLGVKEYMAEIHLTDDVIENNLERENLENIVLDMASQRLALDLEEALIVGDTANAALAPELKYQDGVLKRVTSHIVDHANAEQNLTLYANIQKALPTKYTRNLSAMKYYVHNHLELEWREYLATRQTSLGDQQYLNNNSVSALGQSFATVPNMPKGTILFTDPKNILVGLQRNMRLEYERYPRSRMTAFIFTFKAGFQLEEEDAIVKAINVGAA